MNKEEKYAKKFYAKVAKDFHYLRTEKYKEGWFFNEMLEMPSTLELLGNVKNKKILDIGCGTGIYAKLLSKKGAMVKGFDISPEMIKIARSNNRDLDLRIGSINNIPFKEKFDIVLASLIIHYLDDWTKALNEVKKVLKKDGYFIFSISNPVTEVGKNIRINRQKVKIYGDYFNAKKAQGVWKLESGEEIPVLTNHKTYEYIIKTIIKNGFEIIDYKDCYPLKKSKKLFPEYYRLFSKIPFFCVWKLRLKGGKKFN